MMSTTGVEDMLFVLSVEGNSDYGKQYNVGSPFKRIAIDIAGPFPEPDRENKYIIITIYYFPKESRHMPCQTKRQLL